MAGQSLAIGGEGGPPAIALGPGGQSDGGGTGGGDRGWRGGGEDEGTGPVHQVLAEGRAPGHEPTEGSKRLAERPDEDVGPDTGGGAGAAPARTNDAEGVRLVDDEDGARVGGGAGQLEQGRQITNHAEQGLCHQPPPAVDAGGVQRGAGR